MPLPTVRFKIKVIPFSVGYILQNADAKSFFILYVCMYVAMHILQIIKFSDAYFADYPKFLAETKLVADELGEDHIWSEIFFREATEQDKERIKSALDSEGSFPGNADWAAKLGENLSCSANLSQYTSLM